MKVLVNFTATDEVIVIPTEEIAKEIKEDFQKLAPFYNNVIFEGEIVDSMFEISSVNQLHNDGQLREFSKSEINEWFYESGYPQNLKMTA